MTMTKTLKGTWMTDDGYQRDLVPPYLEIQVINGRAYDAEMPPMARDDVGPLRLDAAGNLRCWAASYFSPDDGEVNRVGRHLFVAA